MAQGTKPLSMPLFKGATRPAMVFGVPTEVFIKVLSPFFLLFIIFYPLGMQVFLLFIPLIALHLMMRDLTKRDNQYMQMYFLHLQELYTLHNNRTRGVRILPPRPISKSSLIDEPRIIKPANLDENLVEINKADK